MKHRGECSTSALSAAPVLHHAAAFTLFRENVDRIHQSLSYSTMLRTGSGVVIGTARGRCDHSLGLMHVRDNIGGPAIRAAISPAGTLSHTAFNAA